MRAASGHLVPVEDGDVAGRAGVRDGQLAAGAHVTEQRVGDRCCALLARKPCEQHRRALLVRRARIGPPGDEHEHDRGSRGEDGSQEILLHARQLERGAIAALTARGLLGEPGLVAEHHDRDVGVTRDRDRLVEAVAGLAVDVAAAGEPDALPEVLAESVENARRVDGRLGDRGPTGRRLVRERVLGRSRGRPGATRRAPGTRSRRRGTAPGPRRGR